MLRDEDIRSLGFESGLLRIKGTTVTRWKDGIDLDFPVLAVEKFARAVEQAAYAAAIKAIEATKIDQEDVRGEGRDSRDAPAGGEGRGMIEVTDIGGHRHYLAPAAIASISQAGASCQWHGIRSHVRMFDGRVIEARDTVDEINERLAKEAR